MLERLPEEKPDGLSTESLVKIPDEVPDNVMTAENRKRTKLGDQKGRVNRFVAEEVE